MILAAIVALSLVAGCVTSLLAARGRIHAFTAVPVVVLLPFLGWLFMQLFATPPRSTETFEVLGQYHRLSDTLRVSGEADANIVLHQATEAGVTVAFEAESGALEVTVERASIPILVGNKPINALPLGRRAQVTSEGADTVVVTRPWLCWRCDTRLLQRSGDTRVEVRLRDTPSFAIGDDSVRLFRIGSTSYLAADPRVGIRVNGVSVPESLRSIPDTLRFGWPDGEALYTGPVPAAHRWEVRFVGAGIQRWVLPVASSGERKLLLSATNAKELPGTLPVLNPAAAAPGGAAQPYGGLLAEQDARWSWTAEGSSDSFSSGTPRLLPRPDQHRTAGHIIQIRQHDTDARAALIAVGIGWLTGAFVLAWVWRALHRRALALRLLALAPLYALVFVRGTLAFRAWIAPPHNVSSAVSFLALLLGLPALIALLHIWHRTAAHDRRWTITGAAAALMAFPPKLRWADARPGTRDLAGVAAVLFAGATLMCVWLLPEWRAGLLFAAGAAMVIPTMTLRLLNGLLLPGSGSGGPLAAFTLPAQSGYGYRDLLSALFVLFVLGFLLVVLTELLRFGQLVTIVAWVGLAVAALATTARPRVRIRRRPESRQPFCVVGGAVVSGAFAWTFGLGAAASVAALMGGGALGWIAAAQTGFRIRPWRLRDLLSRPLLVVGAVAFLAVLFPGRLAASRVVAEYALAIAGLIIISRIFAIVWFRHIAHARDRSRINPQRTPIRAGFGALILLVVAAVYGPMVALDAGLVLLFFGATVAALFVALYTTGARLFSIAIPVAVAMAFFLGMFVLPDSLSDGSANLRTAQIRYAAAYHPDRLEQHILASSDGRPVTSVRTLQQYWGVRHFAAGGLAGRGYFGAPYADWIVPRPVALTENVFSTFVLSEHGWFGGAGVLLAFLSLALALLYGAYRSADDQGAPRAVLLVGTAAFWAVPALYIAGANGVLVPLTGQNIPMLGLLSHADVVLACWLAAIGVTALPESDGSGGAHVPSDGWIRRLRHSTVTVALGLAAAASVLGALLVGPARAEVGDFSMDTLVAGVDSLVDFRALRAVRVPDGIDSIAIAPTAAAHPYLVRGGFVRAGVARSNALARGEPGAAGCIGGDPLVRVRSDSTVVVNGALCQLRSVVERRQNWSGGLVVDVVASEFIISDGRTAVLLDPASESEARIGVGCASPGSARAHTVWLGCGTNSAAIRFGASAPIIESSAGADAQLNGIPVATPSVLRHGDHLRVPGIGDAWALQIPRGALSYARWENGVTRRIGDDRLTPWLTQLDSVFDRTLSHAQRAGWNVTLTLDLTLQTKLQATLEVLCGGGAGWRCSILLADPETGEILASAANETQPHRFLPSDPNLRNHPAASAIKPILGAAALHAFPALSTLEVENPGGTIGIIANTPIAQPPFRVDRRYPSVRVPFRGFLGASDNLYASTLTFIATSRTTSEGLPELRGDSNSSRMRLGGQPLRGRPSWVASGDLDLSRSPLARSLGELFGVHVDSRNTPTIDHGYWDSGVQYGALPRSADLQRVTPEPVGLAMDRIGNARDLASFSIGGSSNRWNNVALVQAVSRLSSGRSVQIHAVRSAGPHDLMSPAPAFPMDGVARRHVLDGMRSVTTESWGTATAALRAAMPPRVEFFAKTGTLVEREWVGSIFLFAGGAQAGASGVCPVAGAITIQLPAGVSPDGVATAAFVEAVLPLLRRHAGWGPVGDCDLRR